MNVRHWLMEVLGVFIGLVSALLSIALVCWLVYKVATSLPSPDETWWAFGGWLTLLLFVVAVFMTFHQHVEEEKAKAKKAEEANPSAMEE